MKPTLHFHQVAETHWGRFKLWVHFRMVTPVMKPLLSRESGLALWKASRRWVFGPNANNEDLIGLLDQLTAKAQEARKGA